MWFILTKLRYFKLCWTLLPGRLLNSSVQKHFLTKTFFYAMWKVLSSSMKLEAKVQLLESWCKHYHNDFFHKIVAFFPSGRLSTLHIQPAWSQHAFQKYFSIHGILSLQRNWLMIWYIHYYDYYFDNFSKVKYYNM